VDGAVATKRDNLLEEWVGCGAWKVKTRAHEMRTGTLQLYDFVAAMT